MAQEPKSVQATIELPKSGLPAPLAANWFNVSHHGGEVQLIMGYLDLYAIAMIAKDAKAGTLKQPASLKPDVTHRFMLSTSGMLQLRAQLEEIFQLMRKAGVVDEGTPQTPSRGTPVAG